MTERFTLLSELGRGGMGVVWKARDEETGTLVALKLLREVYAEDADYVTRFERELELAKRIHSPNVVEVLGFGVRDHTPYLALEYVDGPSLRERLIEHGPYSWPDAQAILAQIAQGLADAHTAGVIHRDLKPSNVLIGSDGVAKLADFGIAKGLDLTRVTGTSTLLGTPAYLAPEGPVDERSDLYSLGVMAFEILTGIVPFEGRTYQEVILRHVREAPNLARLPLEAQPVVGWMLAKDPAERPQRAGELLPVLAGSAPVPTPAPVEKPAPTPAAASVPSTVVGPAVPPIAREPSGEPARRRRRHPILVTFGAIMVCLLVGGIGLVGWSGLVQVPGVSALFGMDHARDLGMLRDPQALSVFDSQYGITWPSATADYNLANPHHWSGTVAVDGTISEGALASLPEVVNANPYLSQISFRIHAGYVEMAAFVKNLPGYPLSGPVYGRFTLERTGPHSVQVQIMQLQAGNVSVPADLIKQAQDELNSDLNATIANSGITIGALELREGAIYFQGQWPRTITADPLTRAIPAQPLARS